MTVVISECLLGHDCKYNGGNNRHNRLIEALEGRRVTPVPVCPETLGGLKSPREPSEMVDGVVMSKEGENVDTQFRKGANAKGST